MIGATAYEMIGLTLNLKVNYTLALASKIDSFSVKSDGIMGLSSRDDRPNFIDLAYDAGYIQVWSSELNN